MLANLLNGHDLQENVLNGSLLDTFDCRGRRHKNNDMKLSDLYGQDELAQLIREYLVENGINCSISGYGTVDIPLVDDLYLIVAAWPIDATGKKGGSGLIDLSIVTNGGTRSIIKYLPEYAGKPIFAFDEDSFPELLERIKKMQMLAARGKLS